MPTQQYNIHVDSALLAAFRKWCCQYGFDPTAQIEMAMRKLIKCKVTVGP